MALSFEQEPISDSATLPVITNWNPLVPYVLYQDASIASFFYYKLVLEVRLTDASGDVIAKIRQRRNGYATDIANNKARAIFDLRDIVNSQLQDTNADQNSTTETIHKIGENVTAKPFSQNYYQIVTIYVKGYQNYSTAANTSPADVTAGSINDTKIYIAASLNLNTSRDTADFQGTSFSSYSLNGSSALFLSDIQASVAAYNLGSVRRNYIQEEDYHTIGFLNGEDDFNSLAQRLYIKYYDSSNAQIGSTQYITNENDTGGAKPETGGTGQVNSDTERLVYFGCGPANLQAQSETTAARPSAFTGWVYYTVQAMTTAPAAKSSLYYFIKQDGSCKDFKVRRLAWINSLGCFDYFNFKMKSVQTLEVTRNNYNTMLGNFNSDMYSYDNFGRGKNTRNTTAILKETLQTDWITEEDATLLEGLIMSNNVQIIENPDTTYTVPVMIINKSFVKKTVANDRMIQYSINIEYANPVNTNS